MMLVNVLISHKILSVLVVLLGLGFISILISAGVLRISKNISDSSILEENRYNYRYLIRNHEKSETTNFEDDTKPQFINENEYTSYGDNYNTDAILNSNFEEEYVCTGSCRCLDSERRTSSIPVVLRTLTYLVSSISSIYAFNQAQKYFETKCQEDLSQECEETSLVKSSVETCNPIIDHNEETIEQLKDKFLGVRKNEERRVYFCYGNCVPSLKGTKFGKERIESTRLYFDGINCGKLRQEGEISLIESDLIHKSLKKGISSRFLQTAIARFQQKYLTDFCKQNSVVDYMYEGKSKNRKTGKEYKNLKKQTGTACVGRSLGKGLKKNQYRNVKCRQIDPNPKSSNNSYHVKNFWRRKKEWDDGDPL